MLEGATARKLNGGYEEETEGEEGRLHRAPSRGDRGSGAGSSRPTTPHKRKGEDRRGGEGERGGSPNRKIDGPKNKTELDLPPRHWMCTVCKKVRRLLSLSSSLFFPPAVFARLVRSSLSRAHASVKSNEEQSHIETKRHLRTDSVDKTSSARQRTVSRRRLEAGLCTSLGFFETHSN